MSLNDLIDTPAPPEAQTPRRSAARIVGAPLAPPTARASIARCIDCAHRRVPAHSDGYCLVRMDMPPAYGEGHPLRRCQPDGGRDCPLFQSTN